MDTPPAPPHPKDALTAYELSRYRRQLEHALKAVPGHDLAHAGLQKRLADLQGRTALPHRDHRHRRRGMTTARRATSAPPPGEGLLVPERPGFMPGRQPTAHPASAGIASEPQDRRAPMIGPEPATPAGQTPPDHPKPHLRGRRPDPRPRTRRSGHHRFLHRYHQVGRRIRYNRAHRLDQRPPVLVHPLWSAQRLAHCRH